MKQSCTIKFKQGARTFVTRLYIWWNLVEITHPPETDVFAAIRRITIMSDLYQGTFKSHHRT